jgi:Secretion system C-terminal sorting domain
MNSDAYKVFPNPFNNEFTVDMKTSGAYKFILLNSFGQIVLENSFNGTQKLIDLSAQAAGMYHYRIVGENKVMSGKVVKQ